VLATAGQLLTKCFFSLMPELSGTASLPRACMLRSIEMLTRKKKLAHHAIFRPPIALVAAAKLLGLGKTIHK
jgi:predicted ATPase with chaperone activity